MQQYQTSSSKSTTSSIETILNNKYVFSSDGKMLGNVVLTLDRSFLVRSIQEMFRIEYEIPLTEIKQILGSSITLHSIKKDIMKQRGIKSQ